MVDIKRIACCRVAIVLLCGTGMVAQVSAPGVASPVRSLASRYVTALQRRDYKTIVELNWDIRLGEASIEADNPKFLWPKLIGDYRERRVRVLQGEELKAINIGEELDFRQVRDEINEQLSFLPPECKWIVAELRPGIDQVGHRFTDVFVTVTYPARETSPKDAEGNPLQRTVLRFVVMAPDNSTVEYFKRVATGDVLWRALTSEGERRTAKETGSPTAVEAKPVELRPPPQPAGGELSPQPPETPSRPVGTYRTGVGASLPKLISKVEPEYSSEARKAKYQGTVVLSAVIGIDGIPGDIKVVRALGLGLDERAIECVSKWRYEPGVRDGKPIASAVLVEVNFRLP